MSRKIIGQDLFTRRASISFLLGVASSMLRHSRAFGSDDKEFQAKLDEIGSDPELAAQMRATREYVEFFPDLQLERAPIKTKPSSTSVSERAIDLIVRCEVTSPGYYTSHYEAPTWPHGPSGITIGIGYDIGYTKEWEFIEDWTDYCSTADRAELKRACGVTGPNAQKLLDQYSSIRIPWEPAMAQFRKLTLPRYVGLTEVSLPNFDKLPPDCRGALVSLVYNRGASFGVPPDKPHADRYTEMRAIKALMINQQFSEIPKQIRGMKRLWEGVANQRGNVVRRDAEAALFEVGLANN